jgi:beta-alanine degradation protein BauB
VVHDRLRRRRAHQADQFRFENDMTNNTENSSNPVSDDVGTRLLFENDRVRVWDLCLAPGDSTSLHRHSADFFYVVIGDGTLQTVYEDGSREEPRDMLDGDVRFREVNGESVHAALNCGSTPWRNIVIELKSSGKTLPSLS